MPNPKEFSKQNDWMDACMHQVKKVEKKPQDQAVAQCLKMWREKDKKKTAADFLRALACRLVTAAGKLSPSDEAKVKSVLGKYPSTELKKFRDTLKATWNRYLNEDDMEAKTDLHYTFYEQIFGDLAQKYARDRDLEDIELLLHEKAISPVNLLELVNKMVIGQK